MKNPGSPHGTASMHLASDVRFLHEQEAVFEAMLQGWTAQMVGGRGYQQAIRSFCAYLCSPHYGWVTECETRFGEHPSQVCHEENVLRHLAEFEGKAGRRPLTRDELQRLLDHVDGEVDRRLSRRR